MKAFTLYFSNSNNTLYDEDYFYGSEIEMLKYANEKLNNKENKLYNLWIYDGKNRMYMDFAFVGRFHRGKKLEKLISIKQQ
jgi:hypothetical protein